MHEQVEPFNKILGNIFQNFIPNKIILCEDKDPPLMDDEIKNLIKRKYVSEISNFNVRESLATLTLLV